MNGRWAWTVRGAVAAAIFVAPTASCTAGSGGVPATGVSNTAQSYCDGREARTRTCSPDGGVISDVDSGLVNSVRSSCEKDYRCKAAIFVAPDIYFNCRASQDCAASSGSEACTRKAGEGRSTADQDACLAKRAGCKSIDDDTCTMLPALTATVAAKVMSCVNGPCDQVKACFDALEIEIPDCN